ncbi:hypothetical protein ACFPRL_29985 [Pseudoclavibacter helvolus]
MHLGRSSHRVAAFVAGATFQVRLAVAVATPQHEAAGTQSQARRQVALCRAAFQLPIWVSQSRVSTPECVRRDDGLPSALDPLRFAVFLVFEHADVAHA